MSSLPVRHVADTDSEYEGLRDSVVVLKSANGEVTESDISRITEELRSARDAVFLKSNSRTYEANGGLSLGCLKSAVTDMLSEFPPEWVTGWDTVLLLYSPGNRRDIESILAQLLDSHMGSPPHKLLSVPCEGDTYVFNVAVNENEFLQPNETFIFPVNPTDPFYEHLKPREPDAPVPFFDNTASEFFAIDALRTDLIGNSEVSPEDWGYRHEPLGPSTFPDFELRVNGKIWGVEVTRVETGLTSYIVVGGDLETRHISKAVGNNLTEEKIRNAVRKALTVKSEKRAQCSHYARYCLLLVDVAGLIDNRGARVWQNIGLSSFEVIVTITLDGRVSYIKGRPALFGGLN